MKEIWLIGRSYSAIILYLAKCPKTCLGVKASSCVQTHHGMKLPIGNEADDVMIIPPCVASKLRQGSVVLNPPCRVTVDQGTRELSTVCELDK